MPAGFFIGSFPAREPLRELKNKNSTVEGTTDNLLSPPHVRLEHHDGIPEASFARYSDCAEGASSLP